MTGEQLRRRGLVQAAVGIVLVAWVTVVAVTAEVGNRQVLVAAAVSGGLACLGSAVSGVVATRIGDAATAARVRHVFVVLEGTVLALFFPFYWFGLGMEPVGKPEDFALGVVLMLTLPVLAAMALTTLNSRAVHKIVVEASGPLVPDSGAGPDAQRIRVIGTVLVTVGAVLAAGVVAVSLTTSREWVLGLVPGLFVPLVPMLLGVKLARVTDVYSARRRNVGMYMGACVGVVPVAQLTVDKVGSGASALLFGVLNFGAVLLLVIAALAVREYIGLWDRPWR